MSAQKESTAVKRGNFLIINNRIVVSNLSRCEFMKCRFTSRTQKAKKDPPDIESYPVSLISVLGSNNNPMSMVYFDWLVTFLENQRMSPTDIVEKCAKLRYIDEGANHKPGIYVWPTKYVLRRKNSSNIVVLVLFTNDANVKTLQNFVAVASSNIYILEDVDMEQLQDRVKEIFAKVRKQPGNFASCPSVFSPLETSRDMKTAATDFFKQLRNYGLMPIKRSNGTELQLKDLRLFLQSVEDKVNKAENVPTRLSQSDTKALSTSKQRETGFVDLEVAKLTNMIATMTVNEDDQKTPSLPTEQTEENVISNNKTEDKSCEELQCSHVLIKLERLLHNWIRTSLTPENISSLFLCCQKNMNEDKHNIFEELQDLVDIIDLHNTQLCNLFDNFVCFAGETDYDQLKLLSKAVHIRSSSRLAAKNHKHSQFTNNILETAANQLHLLYVNVNQNIISNEEETAKNVKTILVSTYEAIFTNLLSQQSKHKSIPESHVLIRDLLISITEKCMNFGNRFNGVAKLTSHQLNNCLEESFRRLKKHRITNKYSVLVIETYIEEYLNIFYAGIEQLVFEQTPEKLAERHLNAVANISTDIQGSFKSSLQLRLYMHLSYITEVVNQKHSLQNLAIRSSNKPFCLHLKFKSYSVHLKTDKNVEFVKYGHQDSSHSYVVLTNKDEILFDDKALHFIENNAGKTKACGSILNLICDPNLGYKYNNYMIERFFKKILCDVEKAFKSKYGNVIIIIPHDLTVENRLCLRKIATCAGMNHVFLISEISLLAYGQICLTEKNTGIGKIDVVVSIQICDEGIRVDIFQERSPNRVQLSAVVFQIWQAGVKSDSSYQCWKKIKTTNPFSSESPTSDCKLTLRSALFNAFSQLDETVEKMSVGYCIFSDNSKHHTIFDEVFKKYSNWSEISNFKEYHAIKAAMHFSDNSFSLVSDILDHGVSIKCFENLENTIVTNRQKFGQTTPDLIIPHLPDLQEKKDFLLQTCHGMKSQLQNGSVTVRRLTKKLIIENIDRAEKIAIDVYTTEEMILSEQLELNELITEHNFSRS